MNQAVFGRRIEVADLALSELPEQILGTVDFGCGRGELAGSHQLAYAVESEPYREHKSFADTDAVSCDGLDDADTHPHFIQHGADVSNWNRADMVPFIGL